MDEENNIQELNIIDAEDFFIELEEAMNAIKNGEMEGEYGEF